MNELEERTNGIYGFSYRNGKVIAPHYEFPQAVRERVNWLVRESQENSMTFMGMMKFLLAYDEQKVKEDWYKGAYQDWLPVTDEFKKWRDGSYSWTTEALLAAELMYGPLDKAVSDEN